MEHVDQVWDRLSFRTPWSGRREREELRLALVRFLNWHAASSRRLVGIEQELTAQVTLPDGQQVTLHGFADRIEVDAEGHVVVVDLKTGKYNPTHADVDVHPQLGSSQLADGPGAVPAPLATPPRPRVHKRR